MAAVYLINRGGRWYYRRRVPLDLVQALGREVKITLRTDSAEAAARMAIGINEATEAYWEEIRAGGEAASLRVRYDRAVTLARRLGWSYRPLAELADRPEELVDRLEAVARGADAGTVAAVLGAVDAPVLMLSGLLEEAERLQPEELRGKNDDQIRRWRNPRRKAIRNIVGVIGDKALAEVSRADALAFRDWLTARLDEGLDSSSLNKDLTHLKGMLRVVIDKHRLEMDNPFSGLMFREAAARVGKHRGATASSGWVERVVYGAALDGLNEEARLLVRILAETGARPGEVCGLEPDDIVLRHTVPHIRIRPNETRAIKTRGSEREIPLIGGALAAAEALVASGGIKRYLGRNVSFSSAVNKYLKENNLFVNEKQSLYSLRHAFQDRLIAAEVPERLQAELMGHKLDRPRYGAGPSLEHKRDWMLRAAVTGPDC